MGARTHFVILAIRVFLPLSLGETFESPSSAVVKGAFVVPVKDALLCSSLFSIEIMVDLPSVSVPSTIRPCDAKPHLCVLLQHAHDVQTILASEIYDKNPYITDKVDNEFSLERLERGLLNIVGQIQSFLWGTATEGDIDKLHVDIGKLALKFNKFSEENHMYMDGVAANISAYTHNLSNAVGSGFQKFQKEINKTAGAINKVEIIFADVSNYLILNQHLQTVVDLMDDVAADCRNKLIPRAVLNNTLLLKKLQEVNAAVADHGFVDAADLNQLLVTEVVSCSFEPGKIKIHIKVPIRRQQVNLKMFKIIHSPFSFREKECTLENPPTFVAQSGGSMIPIIGSLTSLCPMSSKQVCIIPDGLIDPSPFSKCAVALAESKAGEIMKKCIMKCEKATSVRVHPMSSNQFQVTNANNFTIRCNDKNETQYLLQDSVGAVHLHLRCHCEASIHDHFLQTTHIVRPSWPCSYKDGSNDEMITHIIPIQMSSLKSAVFAETSDLYENVSDILNDNWRFDLPSLTLEEPKQIQFSHEFISDELSHTVNHSYTVLFIWVSILTVSVIALGILLVMGNMGQSGQARGFSAVPFMVLFFPGNVFCIGETDRTVTFKSYMWQIIETLQITNVVVNAVILVFVVSVLVILYKGLKNIRLINRMLRAWDNGEDLLISRGY